MSFFIMMLLAGIGNGLGDFFSKLAAGKMSPYISAMLLSLSAVITVGIYFLFARGQNGAMVVSRAGVAYSILGGVSIGAGMVFFFNLFAKGANISVVNPVAKTIVVLSAVLLGVLLLKEKFTIAQAVGTVLSIAGIYFLTK